MSRRAKEYKADVAGKLRADPEYAEHYIRSSISEYGDSLEVALAKAMDQYGHAELALKMEKSAGNISRTVKSLKENGDIKYSTIKDILRCFGIYDSDDSNVASGLILSEKPKVTEEVNEAESGLDSVWNIYERKDRVLKYGS